MTFIASIARIADRAVGRARKGMLGLALAAAALAVSPAAAQSFWQDVQNKGVLRCAAAIAPPYVMKDIRTGEHGGAYLDLCREFAETVLNVKVEFVDTNWDNIVAGLQAGRWDISPALNRTPARALALAYTITSAYDQMNLAYLSNSTKIVDPALDLSTIDQPGIRIGVMSGAAQDATLTAFIKNADIIRIPDPNGLNLALLSGRVDIIAGDATTNMLLDIAHKGKITLLNPEPALMKQGIGFGLPRDISQRDLDVLNIFLEERVNTGYVQRRLEHWGAVHLETVK